jgi:hypothetical protein
MKQLQREPRSLGSRFKEAMKLGGTAKEISVYQTRIQALRLNFQVLAFHFLRGFRFMHGSGPGNCSTSQYEFLFACMLAESEHLLCRFNWDSSCTMDQ